MPLAAILHNKFTAFILLEDFSLEIFKSSSTLCSLNEYNIVNTAFLTALGHAPIPLYLPFFFITQVIPLCQPTSIYFPLIVGTTSMVFNEIIELSNFALQKGADAVMIIPPFYPFVNSRFRHIQCSAQEVHRGCLHL